MQVLFLLLFKAKTEQDINEIILSNPDYFKNDNWFPAKV